MLKNQQEGLGSALFHPFILHLKLSFARVPVRSSIPGHSHIPDLAAILCFFFFNVPAIGSRQQSVSPLYAMIYTC